MCQSLEKVFNQKLATMPAEVSVMNGLVTTTLKNSKGYLLL